MNVTLFWLEYVKVLLSQYYRISAGRELILRSLVQGKMGMRYADGRSAGVGPEQGYTKTFRLQRRKLNY